MRDYDDVDALLADATRWRDETVELRKLLLGCGLDESVKWGKACYGKDDSNLALVQPFKHFVALLFMKGALLDDPAELLEEQGENTRSARRVPFSTVAEIRKKKAALKKLVKSALEVDAKGLKLPERGALELVEELRARLDSDRELKVAFESLTPGRQREYNLYVSGAKQAKTRVARVEKHVDRILARKGLRDRWSPPESPG